VQIFKEKSHYEDELVVHRNSPKTLIKTSHNNGEYWNEVNQGSHVEPLPNKYGV